VLADTNLHRRIGGDDGAVSPCEIDEPNGNLRIRVLILQPSHNLSDERTEYLIRDRLSFMRFLGLGLADTAPDVNTIWGCEALTRARIAGRPAIEVLFERF
jgi:Transposase domain (DUF772)